MKKIGILRLLLILSLLGNIVLICFFYHQKDIKNRVYTDMQIPPCTELSAAETYRRIFVEKNDSVYRKYFGEYYVNTPVQSLMLACTYRLLKPGKETDRDIEAVMAELKGMYGAVPDLQARK